MKPRLALHVLSGRFGACAGALGVIALVVALTVGSRAAVPVPSRPLHTPLYGLTIDDIGNVEQLVEALRRLPQRPTTRISFDAHEPARHYAAAVRALQPVSYVMGELLDSSDEPRIGTATFAGRVRAYLSALGSNVDVWEIGNEVNGSWLGPYRDVSVKLTAAYDAVSAARKRTALTLYYNRGCGDGRSELDPLVFSRQFVPLRVRDGVDFVLISYYEQNCHGIRPSASSWRSYFSKLHALYPHAQVGFGEIGLNDPVGDPTLRYAEGMIRYYYGLPIHLPYYAGGYFWWYCDEDCVPFNAKPLFGALRGGFTAEAAALRRRP